MNVGRNPRERIDALLNKIKALRRGGDLDSALKAAAAAEAAYPCDDEVRDEIWQIQTEQNDYEKALRTALDGGDPERVQESLDELRRRTPPNLMAPLLDRLLADGANAHLLTARAAAARDQNRPDEEIGFLLRAVEAGDAAVGTWIELINAYVRADRLTTAVEQADLAGKHFPGNRRLSMAAESVRRRRDQHDLAHGRYREVVESTLLAGRAREFHRLVDNLRAEGRDHEAETLLATAAGTDGVGPESVRRPADNGSARVAESATTRLIAARPPLSDAEMAAGLAVLRRTGDLAAAERLVAGWLRAHAVSGPLRVPLGLLYLDLGRYAEGAELLLDAGDEYAVRDKIAELREDGDLTSAETLAREALRRRPRSLGLLQQSGLIALMDHRWDRALRDAARMLEINPRSFDAYEIRFDALAATYQRDAVDRDLEHILGTYQHVPDFLVVAAQALMGRRRLPEAEDQLRAAIPLLRAADRGYPRRLLAETLIQLRRPGEALEILAALVQDAAAAGESDVDLREHIAFAHLYGNDLPAAREEAAAVLDRDDTRITAYRVMGVTYLRTGDYPIAESWLRKAVERDPGEPQSMELALAILEQDDKSRLGEIRGLCGTARKADDRNPDVITMLGKLKLSEGDEAEAERLLDRAIALDGLDAFEPLGALFVSQGRFDEAEKIFERGLVATFHDPDLQTELANLHLQRGQLAPAAELFRSLMSADPYNGLAVVGLALALTEADPPDLVQADALLATAQRRQTRYPDRVLVMRAYVGARIGGPDREAEALALVDAAIELHPVAEYHNYAARLRAYRGDFRGALRAVDAFHATAPDDPRAGELRRRITAYRRAWRLERLAAHRGQFAAVVAAVLLAALWTIHLRTGVDTAVLLGVSGFLATVVLAGVFVPNPKVAKINAAGIHVDAGSPGAPELPPIRTGIPLLALKVSASVLPPAPAAPRKRAAMYTAHQAGIQSGLTRLPAARKPERETDRSVGHE
jgi:tetratricopeptide (TPR) repeat protein